MALIDALYALIAPVGRHIGGIIPDVVVEEIHQDDLAVTDHPVETGAAISDHAFLLPKRLEMRIGFSDSTAGAEGYVEAVYNELLALQASRTLFSVSTGKRRYRNMLLTSIVTVTDQKTESALMAIARMREVILVSTQGGGGLAPNSAMAEPQSTGSVIEGGTVQPIDTGSIIPPGLSIGLSPNAIQFGSNTTLNGALVGNTPGGGAFGIGGPSGNAQF